MLPALLVVGCAAPTGDGFAVPPRSAVLFFADGMDAGVLQAMLSASELPAIRRRFVEGGVTVARAVVCLPSITYPNAVSMITGQFPGHHGVLGNRWFDRYTLECRDYASAETYRSVNADFVGPTLYDVLHDRFTVSVQNHTRRGVTHTIDHVVSAGIDWGLGRYSSVDRRVGRTIDDIEMLANQTQRWPSVLTFYFPGLDEIGHRDGPDAPRYHDAMRAVDGAIGRVFDKIERLGLLERTSFALVTDHGHVPIGRRCAGYVEAWLRNEAGLRVSDHDLRADTYAGRLRELGDANAYVVPGAERSVMVHVRGNAGWHERPTSDAIERVVHPRGHGAAALYDDDRIALVVTRAGENSVRIFSGAGAASVLRRRSEGDAEYTYHVERGDDPLGYVDDPVAAGLARSGWHASREWLVATARTDYPDFVPQIVSMFDSPRAGDLVVFAADDTSFLRRGAGGHGSCLARDMIATYYFAGPELPAGGRVEMARLVDVMPTMVDLLGESARLDGAPNLDGVSIADELRRAEVLSQ